MHYKLKNTFKFFFYIFLLIVLIDFFARNFVLSIRRGIFGKGGAQWAGGFRGLGAFGNCMFECQKRLMHSSRHSQDPSK